jgi:hypothetical protein
MATVVFVQMYPFEARFGGDPEYVMKLGQHFKARGHSVHLLVSDMVRGRSLPWYKTPYPIETYDSYRVRGGLRAGRLVASFDPRFVLNIAARIWGAATGRKRAKSCTHDAGEVRWVSDAVNRLGADIVVLCFGAVELAAALAAPGRYVVALPSVVPGRRLALNEAHSGAMTAATDVPEDFLHAVGDADVIAVTIEDDAAALRRALPHKDVIITKVGSEFRQAEPAAGGADMLFVGNETAVNGLSVRWFIDEVLPLVRMRVPHARLRVVGRVARTVDRQHPNVELVGTVDDLAPEYARAHVVVAPIRQGTASMKSKVVEAITFGCPVVTSSIGVDPANPRQFDEAGYVADTPEAFAAAACRLLLDPQERAAKAHGARAVHERYFSPAASYGALEQRIDAFLAGGTRTPEHREHAA